MKSELEQAIENLPHPLTAECKLIGYVEAEGDKWPHHKWLVTLRYNGQTFSTEFRTGIGNAKDPRIGPNYIIYNYSGATAPANWRTDRSVDAANFRARWYADKRSAVAPSLADVLDCLMSDSSGGALSLEDFCGEFGYDIDSRKAEKTWQACRNTFIGLHVLFMTDYGSLEGKQH